MTRLSNVSLLVTVLRARVRLYHPPQSKCILISRDVVFVEDVMQPLLSCTKEAGISSRDVFDTLLPLFTGGSSHVPSTEAYV